MADTATAKRCRMSTRSQALPEPNTDSSEENGPEVKRRPTEQTEPVVTYSEVAAENAALKLQNGMLQKQVRDLEEQLQVIRKLLTEQDERQRAQWAVLHNHMKLQEQQWEMAVPPNQQPQQRIQQQQQQNAQQKPQPQPRRHVQQVQKQQQQVQQRPEPKPQWQGPQLETMRMEEFIKSVTAEVTSKIIGEQQAALRQQRQSPTLAQMVADVNVPASYEWTRVPTKAEQRQARTTKQQKQQQQQQQQKPATTTRRRMRNDVVRVVPATGKTCEDVATAVRKDQKVNAVVDSITKNAREHTLVKLKPSADAQAVQTAISEMVGEAALATCVMSEMTTVCIRDIDMLATPEDVANAVEDRIHVTIRAPILNRMRNGLQTTRFSVPRRRVSELTESKLRISYTRCRVKELGPLPLNLKRCYRCLERGHLMQDCKGPDRASLCLNCGQSEHNVHSTNKVHHLSRRAPNWC
ncbi:bromodomain-containing protein DDB_G0280777-like [Anopheles cruzii]|uniref:bromodomain-containing protein DDB_G0280777-like n=1 Tax=Anopheles cruzii TaxID=68878 RepID=UPI0022EC48ED|nr:bromodomain-containing protein DDB_G0280777-like [Anopheles cruzii]